MSLDNQDPWTTRTRQAYPWVGREGSGLTLVTHLSRGFYRVQRHCPARDRKGFQRHRSFPWVPGGLPLPAPLNIRLFNFISNLPTPRTQKQKHQRNLCSLSGPTHPSLGLDGLRLLHPQSPLPSWCPCEVHSSHTPSSQSPLPCLCPFPPLPTCLLSSCSQSFQQCLTISLAYLMASIRRNPVAPCWCSVSATQSSLPCPAHICCLFHALCPTACGLSTDPS